MHSNFTSITIPLLTSRIELTINLRHGEWRRGLVDSNATYPTIQIDLFTSRHIGVYDYAFQMFDGREGMISVNIIATGLLNNFITTSAFRLLAVHGWQTLRVSMSSPRAAML